MKEIDETFGDARPKWLEFFEESPVDALDELFTNSYYHGPLNVVEPEDLLLDWTAAIDSSPFSEMLDSSIARWIERRWNEGSTAGESLGLMWQRALRVIALVDAVPNQAVNALHRRRTSAVSYLGPLVLNRACDPLGWYWASISRVQADDGLVWQWFRLCNLVPGTPAFHGQWGLLGLQRAPGADRGGFRTRVAAGLEQYLKALHAKVEEQRLAQKEAERLALGAAQELKRRYPFPNRWREYWGSYRDADLPGPVRRWVVTTWDERVFRPPTQEQRRHWHRRGDYAEWAGRATSLAGRLRKSSDLAARKDAEALLRTQRSYALDTGNSYYIVRTLCRFSTIILDRDNSAAIAWAEEAIGWEPWNPYCWSTVIAARKAVHDIEGAMRLSFEAIDRFPDDAVVRNGLAEVLRQAGRLNDARAAYQEVIDRFPHNVFARTGMAEVLRQGNRLGEAEAAYRKAIELFPDNAYARTGVAAVLRQAGRLDEARAAYQEAVDRFPSSTAARSGLAAVLRAIARAGEAEATPHDTGEPAGNDTADLEGPAPAARAGEAEATPHEPAEDDAEDDTVDHDAERHESPRVALRANMHHALLLKGEERQTVLEQIIDQADDLLGINSYDVDALYTKAEALLALGSYESVDKLLTALPKFIADRPDFQAVQARLRTARLMSARPQPFDPSIVQSVVDSWNTASRSAVELRGVATIAGLRVADAMVDGAPLNAFRENAVTSFSRLVSEQVEPQRDYSKSKLSAWWLTAVRHAVIGSDHGTEVTYGEIAPQLEQCASLLDALDGELVNASRYTYAPR